MTDKPKFSIELKLSEIEREVRMRKDVYGRMSFPNRTWRPKSEADLATEIMADIAEDYRRALAKKKEKAA